MRTHPLGPTLASPSINKQGEDARSHICTPRTPAGSYFRPQWISTVLPIPPAEKFESETYVGAQREVPRSEGAPVLTVEVTLWVTQNLGPR